jgi:hypothetical protein
MTLRGKQPVIPYLLSETGSLQLDVKIHVQEKNSSMTSRKPYKQGPGVPYTGAQLWSPTSH